jgi:hypothetical protein
MASPAAAREIIPVLSSRYTFSSSSRIFGAITAFDPAIELDVIRNSSGYHLFLTTEDPPRGENFSRALHLPPGGTRCG